MINEDALESAANAFNKAGQAKGMVSLVDQLSAAINAYNAFTMPSLCAALEVCLARIKGGYEHDQELPGWIKTCEETLKQAKGN